MAARPSSLGLPRARASMGRHRPVLREGSMIVIGVTGFRRTGKNLTTEALVQHLGFKPFAFADSLRTMASSVNPVISLAGAPTRELTMLSGSIGTLHGQHKTEWRYNELLDALSYDRAKNIPDFRGFLQKLGTEGVRATF